MTGQGRRVCSHAGAHMAAWITQTERAFNMGWFPLLLLHLARFTLCDKPEVKGLAARRQCLRGRHK